MSAPQQRKPEEGTDLLSTQCAVHTLRMAIAPVDRQVNRGLSISGQLLSQKTNDVGVEPLTAEVAPDPDPIQPCSIFQQFELHACVVVAILPYRNPSYSNQFGTAHHDHCTITRKESRSRQAALLRKLPCVLRNRPARDVVSLFLVLDVRLARYGHSHDHAITHVENRRRYTPMRKQFTLVQQLFHTRHSNHTARTRALRGTALREVAVNRSKTLDSQCPICHHLVT